MTELAAMPLQVRRAAKVCKCGRLEQEHHLTSTGRRTWAGEDCRLFEHATDRYAVSTYVDVPAGEAAPEVTLQRAERCQVNDGERECRLPRGHSGDCYLLPCDVR